VALILAVTLFRQFDFLTLTFEKTGPAIVYIIGLLIAVVILVKNARER
jgi:multisubunit Na+/H+ antiporter MnhG subunit